MKFNYKTMKRVSKEIGDIDEFGTYTLQKLTEIYEKYIKDVPKDAFDIGFTFKSEHDYDDTTKLVVSFAYSCMKSEDDYMQEKQKEEKDLAEREAQYLALKKEFEPTLSRT